MKILLLLQHYVSTNIPQITNLAKQILKLRTTIEK